VYFITLAVQCTVLPLLSAPPFNTLQATNSEVVTAALLIVSYKLQYAVDIVI